MPQGPAPNPPEQNPPFDRPADTLAPATGVYELRIHGVSGTPPAAMLGVPSVTRVAGDEAAGFYRPQDAEGHPVEADGEGSLVEAYSWGGLTSGGKLRALWLLLTPCTLVNVAFFMAALPLGVKPADFPAPAGDDDRNPKKQGAKPWRATRYILETALRLLALTLTLTVMLAAAAVFLDVVGWQYPRSGAHVTWLSFLSWPWLAPEPRPFLLMALLPLALLALLWWLSHYTS